MKPVRLGIIGLGNMGRGHTRNIEAGKVPGVELVAVCDIDPDALAPLAPKYQRFADSRALIRSGLVEAVLIATPHYSHTTIGIDALQQGLHVLVEKPISVHKADAEKLIQGYHHRPRRRQVFAAMFNQRTDPRYRKIRQLIRDGELGTITRMNWIITNWFRTEAYYASGGWRATWAGEGGGVLLNQCPHNLDLLIWLCGMPTTVTAQIQLGRWHQIEVEDDVTAHLTFPGGATGVFVTGTGEAPGTNRLEIVGTRGKLVEEGGSLTFFRNEVPMDVVNRTSPNGFGRPEYWRCAIELPAGNGGQHVEILQNFAQTIRGQGELIAPAVEGRHSVELANAMILSGLTGRPVEIPLSAAGYARMLKRLIADSAKRPRRKRRAVTKGAVDLSKSV
jgi:predicted dehydrogenase